LREWVLGYIVGSVPSRTMVEQSTTTDQTTNEMKKLPLDGDKTTTILLNVEEDIKSLIQKLAKRVEIGNGVDIPKDQLSSLPTSITGVVVHFITKGLESEFGIGFENEPRSLKVRGISNYDKKVAGKKRLLSRDQKNDLLAKTTMTYYDKKIASGEMTVENAMYSIKDAYERKTNYEEMGYILPPEKTKYPYWEGENATEDDE